MVLRTLCLLVVGVLPLAASGQARYESVAHAVSFDDVLALAYRDADARIHYDTGSRQYGLLWLPPGQREARALLVFIHGGCWLNEFTVEHSYAASTALADAGFAVWSLEYRATGDTGGGWPGTFADIRAGIEFHRRLDLNPAYSLANKPLGIIGHSAGGHLALLAAAELRQSETEPVMVAALAGITDIARYATGTSSCESAAVAFMGGRPDEVPARYAQANPVQQTLPTATWILHGREDQIVAPTQARLAGTRLRMVNGAGHFDWIHPGTEAFQQLLSVLESSF